MMEEFLGEATPFRGNMQRTLLEVSAWLGKAKREVALEPELPIVDAHHHLWDDHRGRYLLEEFLEDLSGGHSVRATIHAQCMAMFRADGAELMKPVGETEFVAGMAAMSESGRYGGIRVAEGIIAFADLTAGNGITPVLEAHVRAGGGRLRGIRQPVQYDASSAGAYGHPRPPKGMLLDSGFREGFRRLADHDLAFDVWMFHPQLSEAVDLAKTFPGTTIVIDHVGGALGVGPYAGRRDELFDEWSRSIGALAEQPNVVMKLGGLGMLLFGFDFHEKLRPPTSEELAAAWRPYIERCIEAFGANRCMFESNFPPDRQSCGYTELWNAFKRITSGCSAAEKAALYAGVATRVYRLDGAEQR